MTRQVALAAVVAFGITVLVLSIWKPSAEAPPPQPQPVTPTVVAPQIPGPQLRNQKLLVIPRRDGLGHGLLQPAQLDAGSP